MKVAHHFSGEEWCKIMRVPLGTIDLRLRLGSHMGRKHANISFVPVGLVGLC
jgi:hypothetical protein